WLINGEYSGKAPEIDLKVEKDQAEKLLAAIQKGIVQSAEDIAEGGLAVALSESVIRSNGLGAHVTISGDKTVALFSESQSRYIVTVKEENTKAFEALGFNAKRIGTVTDDGTLVILHEEEGEIIREPVSSLEVIWKESIAKSLN
ncbi:MAG: phosphoribosylformylglycinamidine synthase II, partial [Bacillales bacterium]